MLLRSLALQGRITAVLFLWATIAHSQTPDNTIRPITDEQPTCQPINSPTCGNVGYSEVYLPNFRGQNTQSEANGELSDFVPLIQSGCSNAILHFLCGYYLPICQLDSFGMPVTFKPCRTLCEFVRSQCEATLESLGAAQGLTWPAHLNCSLDDFAPGPSCFGPPNINDVILPSFIIVPTTTSVVQPSSTVVIMATPPPVTTTPPPTVMSTDGSGAPPMKPNILLIMLFVVTVLCIHTIWR